MESGMQCCHAIIETDFLNDLAVEHFQHRLE
jgi:hypothetical protein